MCQMCQMLNIWHIYHTKHQKRPFIRCVKCAKLLQHVTISSQFWHDTDRCCIIYIIILFSFFSLLFTYISLSPSSHLCILSHLSSLIVFHSTPITIGCSTPPISPKTTTWHRRPFVFSIPLQVLFFFFFLFSIHFFWLWFDGWIRVVGNGNGWVEMCRSVVGGFGLWVMAAGGLRWADRWWVGSGCGLWRWVGWDGDGQISGGWWVGWWWANRWWANQRWRIGGGANFCSNLFLSLFFCFGGGFSGGCGFFFFFS